MESLIFLGTIIVFVWSLVLQYQLKSVFKKYSQIRVQSGISGADTADSILTRRGIRDVAITPIQGQLTDHYNPRDNTVNLSTDVFHQPSIASVAVAAHEVGHVLQYYDNSWLMRFRTFLLPSATLGSNAAIPLFFIGMFFGQGYLMQLGILLFVGIFVFHFITLPVEIDASRRALKILSDDGYLTTTEEYYGAKKVLRYAALTYLASLLMSALQLIRMILIARRD